MMRKTFCVLASTAVVASGSFVAASSTPASAEDTMEEMTARYIAKSHGVSLGDARDRVASQDSRGKLGRSLERTLGERASGSYLDQKAGTVVVNVTTKAAAETVKERGATPRLVKYSGASLAKSRAAASKRLGNLQVSSGINPETNRVVVEVLTPDRAKAERALEGMESVTLKTRDRLPRPAVAEKLYGGLAFNFGTNTCSVGFLVAKGTKMGFVTAGHCAPGLPHYYRGGIYLGTAQAKSYPGNDYAWSTVSTNFDGDPLVYNYNSQGIKVHGYTSAPYGAAICKSGKTTKWTCGKVTDTDFDITYTDKAGNKYPMQGLVKHTACVEQGDSGGSVMAGNQAVGISSGSRMHTDAGLCGEKVGRANEAYYQPITEVMSAYGLGMLVTE